MGLCAHCGKQLPPNAIFCTYCGRPANLAAVSTHDSGAASGQDLRSDRLEALPLNGEGRFTFKLGDLKPADIVDWPDPRGTAGTNASLRQQYLETVKSTLEAERFTTLMASVEVKSPWPIRSCCIGRPDVTGSRLQFSYLLFPSLFPFRQFQSVALLLFDISTLESGEIASQVFLDDLRLEELHLQTRLDIEVIQAPEVFQKAFGHLATEDWTTSVAALSRPFEDPTWDAVARCCKAYGLMKQARHEEAISCAESVRIDRVPLVGRWYCYRALVYSLNMKDEVERARSVVEEALEYFQNHQCEWALEDLFEQKANILKQLASPISRDLSRHADAKSFTVEAIRCLCLAESLSGKFPSWAPADHREEIKALARIAARVALRRDELPFLDEIEGIEEWKERYFTPKSMKAQAGCQANNVAAEFCNSGHNDQAVPWFQRALDLTDEESGNARAFKAFVAYQCGLCLLRLHALEGVRLKAIPASKRDAVTKIRQLWNDCIRLFASLDEATRRREESDISGVKQALIRDPLMRGQFLVFAGLELAQKGQKEEGLNLLKKALDDLDETYPDDRKTLSGVHMRLATLCSDTGRKREASEHARWVLQHVPDLEDNLRLVMKEIAGRESSIVSRLQASNPAGTTRFCTSCGAPTPAQDRFCTKCGAPIRSTAAGSSASGGD